MYKPTFNKLFEKEDPEVKQMVQTWVLKQLILEPDEVAIKNAYVKGYINLDQAIKLTLYAREGK